MPVDSVRLSFQGDGLWVLNVIIGLVMFGSRSTCAGETSVRVVRSPTGPLIGLAAQFVALPGAYLRSAHPAPGAEHRTRDHPDCCLPRRQCIELSDVPGQGQHGHVRKHDGDLDGRGRGVYAAQPGFLGKHESRHGHAVSRHSAGIEQLVRDDSPDTWHSHGARHGLCPPTAGGRQTTAYAVQDFFHHCVPVLRRDRVRA